MFKKLLKGLFARNTLYYPGCLISSGAAGDLNENYQEILKKLGIEFLSIPEFVCCGSPVLNAGYKSDYEDLKKKNLDLLKKYAVKRIITPCPACTKTFLHDYKLEDEGIKVLHISQIIEQNIDKIKDVFGKKALGTKVTYHDPCHLGRHCKIYDAPRRLLVKAGYMIEEFDKNRENAVCCGGGGGVKANFPNLADQVAKMRIAGCKTKTIITTCPLCYLHLKENAGKHIEVKELSQVIKDAI